MLIFFMYKVEAFSIGKQILGGMQGRRSKIQTLVLKGRLGKWMLALAEFDLGYELAKATEQVLADLLMEHSGSSTYVKPMTWALFFFFAIIHGHVL
jgi:hypothetical protein